MGFLFYLNWQITLITLVVLAVFGYVLSYAFKQLRPLFRDRGEIEAGVTGRLNEGLGRNPHRQSLHRGKTRRISVLPAMRTQTFSQHRNSMTGVSATGAFASVIIGAISVVMIYFGGNAVIANI